MDESLDANSTKKRNIPANVPIKAAKKKRFNEENSKKGESRVHSIPLNDWMVGILRFSAIIFNLGCLSIVPLFILD